LLFSYGVIPVFEPDHPKDWKHWINSWLKNQDEEGDLAILTEGPSRKFPNRNNRMEIIDLRNQ
jgi:pyruvate kinase